MTSDEVEALIAQGGFGKRTADKMRRAHQELTNPGSTPAKALKAKGHGAPSPDRTPVKTL